MEWVKATSCPSCKAPMALGEGFERIFEPADESIYKQDVVQVQCEACAIYFGTINADTLEILDRG